MIRSSCLFIIAFIFTSTLHAQNIYTKAGTASAGSYQPATTSLLAYPADLAVDANGNILFGDGFYIKKISATDGKIYPVAGTGVTGYNGDDRMAISAKVGVSGIVISAAGDIFVADGPGNRIRKISAANGKITTVAGNGTAGYSGDGGSALSAQISSPRDVAVDAAGNLFIVDGNNNRIRKVTAADGKISTIAGNGNWGFSGDGGPAIAAEFTEVRSVAVDATGNVYFADAYNYRIRKIGTDGKISTFAGTGELGVDVGEGGPANAAMIGEPVRITIDNNNNVVFSDSNGDFYSYRVRRVNAVDGTIHVIAGSSYGFPVFGGDGGPANAARMFNPNGVAFDKTGNLFIADASNARIRKVNASDQVISTIARVGTENVVGNTPVIVGDQGPSTLTRLRYPTAVAVDATGNVYISDNGNNSIRKINAADDIINSIAGNGAAGFSGDGGPAKSALLNTGFSNHPPGCLIMDKAGNIYFGDNSNYRIRKINATDGTISTIAGNGVSYPGTDGGLAVSSNIGMPTGMAFDSKGDLYFINLYSSTVRKINMTTGIISTVIGSGEDYWDTDLPNGDGGPASAALFTNIISIAIDANDNIYTSEGPNIRKVNASNGVINTIAGSYIPGYGGDNGPASAAQFNGVETMITDASGNIYLTDFTYSTTSAAKNHLVRKINTTTGIITTIAGVDRGSSGDGGLATLAKLSEPTGLAFDRNGTLFIADMFNHKVRYICTNESLATVNLKETRGAYPEDSTTMIVFNNNCSMICNLSPDGAAPVAGFMDANVWIESSVISEGDQPYVQRHYNITPELNAAGATAKVNLYFTQAESDAYNASAKVSDGTYFKLPSGAADATGIANLRIAFKSGISNNNTGLPGTYSGTATHITPSAVQWDAVNNWWKVSFDAQGLGGFFITTEKTPPPPIPAAHNLFVPNVFSPNGDSKNDVLMVYGNHIATARLQIFNQWGQKIFEGRNAAQQGWDGKVGGKIQPVGVYIYTLEVKLDDGTIINRKGAISLVK